MPFGEYIPFVESFPWLEQIVITAGDFTAGRDVSVFDFTRCPDPASEIEPENCPVTRAAPLICYEDVIPDLARQATLAGAQLLVNLTNDAWFGDTAAPYQHHIIASFRAIENRRTLLRSTNSGLTAIVDPLGRTTSYLKPFSEGVILTEVALLSGFTLYTRYFGDLLWWGLAIICACTIFYQKVINKGGPQNFHTRS